MIIEGTGRIGLQTIWRLAELEKARLAEGRGGQKPETILAIDVISFEDFVAGLTGRLKVENVIKDGKVARHSEITTEPCEFQPHFFDPERLGIAPQHNNTIKVYERPFVEHEDDGGRVLFTIKYIQAKRPDGSFMNDDEKMALAKEYDAKVWASCTGMKPRVEKDGILAFAERLKQQSPGTVVLVSAPTKGKDVSEAAKALKKKMDITVTRNFSRTGTLFRYVIDLNFPAPDGTTDYQAAFIANLRRLAAHPHFKNFIGLDEGIERADQVEGKETLIHIDTSKIKLIRVDKDHYKLKLNFWEDNEYGYSCVYARNVLALAAALQDRTLNASIPATTLLTVINSLHGDEWFEQNIDAILANGNVSASSCTTNGNITGLIASLMPFNMLLLPESIQKFSDFSVDDIQAMFANVLARMVRYVDIHMEHGLTLTEDPRVVPFVREVSSGSQTEVPLVLADLPRE